MGKKYALLAIVLAFGAFPIAQAQDSFDEYVRKKKQNFNNYVTERKREFDEYRRQRNEEFARYMGQKWQQNQGQKPITLPKEKEVLPRPYDERRDGKQENKHIEAVVVPVRHTPVPQPKPIDPIEENNLSTQRGQFMFYGTRMDVRWGDVGSLRLRSIDEKEVARVFLKMTDKEYTDLMADCLKLRHQYRLCDWAYYKMTETMARAAYGGKQCNEAVLLQGVVLSQSGYKLRFASDKQKGQLYLLMRVQSDPIDCSCFKVSGEVFYVLDGTKVNSLHIMDRAYPGEQAMSLNIEHLPALNQQLTPSRQLRTNMINVSSSVNKNLINFFNDYPRSCSDHNFMTRWAYYANTPVSPEVKKYVYPILRERIVGQDEIVAVSMLLEWVQQCFPYAYDDKVWHADRAFFAEESLFYPGCDCEDHAILFSHLVRDLVGLDVCLVYTKNKKNEGHLLTAIGFNSEVKGHSVTVSGKRFVMADPTWPNYPVGRIGAEFYNYKPSVILLGR
jgi:hypothetical protein